MWLWCSVSYGSYCFASLLVSWSGSHLYAFWVSGAMVCITYLIITEYGKPVEDIVA